MNAVSTHRHFAFVKTIVIEQNSLELVTWVQSWTRHSCHRIYCESKHCDLQEDRSVMKKPVSIAVSTSSP